MVKVFTSIFLIVVALLGAIGVNYDTHYCGGVLVDQQLSIIPSDLSCGMSADMDASADKSGVNFSQACCENHHFGFQISDDYNDYRSAQFLFISNSSFPEIRLEYISFIPESEYNFIGYSPPPLLENILLKKESFLI